MERLKILFDGSNRREPAAKTSRRKRPERIIMSHGASSTRRTGARKPEPSWTSWTAHSLEAKPSWTPWTAHSLEAEPSWTKRRNAEGRAFVDTLENTSLRGRAFVDAVSSLGDTLENGPSRGQLGSNMDQHGPTWGHLGAILGPLRQSWAKM